MARLVSHMFKKKAEREKLNENKVMEDSLSASFSETPSHREDSSIKPPPTLEFKVIRVLPVKSPKPRNGIPINNPSA